MESTEVALKFAHCQKQKGGTDCSLFAIAFATAIVFGKQTGKFKFVQEELRSHMVMCLIKVKCIYSITSKFVSNNYYSSQLPYFIYLGNTIIIIIITKKNTV